MFYILVQGDIDNVPDIHIFNKREYLRPSVERSYSRCQDVEITESNEEGYAGKVIFTITGKRDSEAFRDQVIFHRRPLWNEPTHL